MRLVPDGNGENMTKDEIIEVLAHLHKITGFRVSLHGADYSEIAAYPKPKCEMCRLIHGVRGEYDKCVLSDKSACKAAMDKKGTHIYKCRYGMTEAVSPLYNFGTLTGFLMMGQVYDDLTDREEKRAELAAIGISEREIDSTLMQIPTVRSDMIYSFVKIMTICAQYLTISNAIPLGKPTVAQLAREYIYHHYHSHLSIKKICTEVGCSKSALITSFKNEYGTTVNSYITEIRLGEALRMLERGENKIGEIAEACGFSDQSYFSKVFSARYGVPPSEYEKILANGNEFWR